MPELPEVETVARTLAPLIGGKGIVAVNLLNPGTVQGPVPLASLEGLRISPVQPTSRRGKLLFVHVEDADSPRPSTCDAPSHQQPYPTQHGWPEAQHVWPEAQYEGVDAQYADGAQAIWGFAVHLKMTGRLFVHPAGTPPNSHTRVLFHLDDGSRLFFDDARKFGYLRVLTAQTLHTWPFYQHLGPEPLEVDATGFVRCFAGRRSSIKSLLLNQTCIAGCGNIYADEALFRAGIAPQSSAQHLNNAQFKLLHRALQEVLRESIAACGSSIRDYRTANGDVGAFQNAFAVYNRAGQACVQCGGLLEKVQVAGRTTVYCPRCQH